MVFRFILYTLIAYLALTLLRRLVTAAAPSARPPKKNARARDSRQRSARLVRCARCGMFVAESSALLVKGAEFCSRACAEKEAVHRA
ncbi:MAG TPA: PP0621 family protein [Blastocatellia bacterium]|nr:PP0621 family protein [Blastocatellia bacterium]